MNLKNVKKYNLNKSFDSFNSARSHADPDIQHKRGVALIRKAIETGCLENRYERIISDALKDLEKSGSSGPDFKICAYAAEEMSRLSDELIVRYLFHRYRYIVNPAERVVDNYPPCLQIELTSICNYRCTFCYQSDASFNDKDSGHMGTMSFERFKRIVDQAEGNVDFVTLASRGEPLLAKDFIEMVEYTKGKFLSLKINTNASALTESKAHAILSSGVSTLVFSADSADEKLYGEYRVNGNLDKVLENIKRFNEIKANEYPGSKILTRISGVMVDPEKQNIESMISVWGELADQVSFVKYSPWEKIYQAEPNEIVTSCSDLWRRMFIWFDGSVSPCDNDYKASLKIGSIDQNSITDIWLSSEYNGLRKSHLDHSRGELEPCRRCVVF